MPVALRAEWRGLSEYQAFLRKLPEPLRNTIEDILTSAMVVGMGEAQIRVPVRTGALLQSIVGQRSGLRIEIKAYREYAPFVEFGTRKMSAKPFIRPALYRIMEFVRDVLPQKIRDALARARS